jgi:hypothetical protein
MHSFFAYSLILTISDPAWNSPSSAVSSCELQRETLFSKIGQDQILSSTITQPAFVVSLDLAAFSACCCRLRRTMSAFLHNTAMQMSSYLSVFVANFCLPVKVRRSLLKRTGACGDQGAAIGINQDINTTSSTGISRD